MAGWGGRVAAVLVLAYPFGRQLVTGGRADITDYVFAFVIASFLWSGASAAIMSARVRRRLPALRARDAGPPYPRGARTTCRSPRRSAGRRRSRPAASWSSTRPARPIGDRQRGRGARDPRGPPRPGCRSARSPARLEPGLTSAGRHRRRAADPGHAAAPATEYLLLDARRQRLRRPGHRRRRPGLRRRQSEPAAARIGSGPRESVQRMPPDDARRRLVRRPPRPAARRRVGPADRHQGPPPQHLPRGRQAVLHQPRPTSTTTT